MTGLPELQRDGPSYAVTYSQYRRNSNLAQGACPGFDESGLSLDAAALLAQVLPVGVIVLVLESRRGIGYISRRSKTGRVLTIAYWLLFTVASLGGINATAFGIGLVVTDSPPSEAMSTIILVPSYIVFLGLAAFTTLLAVMESGVLEMIGESAQETRARRAARKQARQGRHEAEDS